MYERDRKKVRVFSSICAFVDELYTGIRYTGSTVEEMLVECADNSLFSDLLFLKLIKEEICDTGMKEDTFNKSVLRSAKEMNITIGEFQPLIIMSKKLGTTDVEGQLKLLSICKTQIEEQRGLLAKQCDSFGKMYISLGFLLGLGTAVILA